jgi:hypothetical protein
MATERSSGGVQVDPDTVPDPSLEAAARDVDPMEEAVAAAHDEAERTGGLGQPGKAMNWRSPFFIGLTGAAGVAVTYGLIELVIKARSMLILIGLALFIAASLDPVVAWLCRLRVPRWAAVLMVVIGALAVAAGFLAAAVPPMAAQATALVHNMPHYMHELQDHNSSLGRLNAKYHIQQRVTSVISSKGGSLIGGVLGAGELVLSTVSSMLLVLVLSVYFLASLPKTKLFAYRDLRQGRRLHARQPAYLGHRRPRYLLLDAGLGHPLSGAAGAADRAA